MISSSPGSPRDRRYCPASSSRPKGCRWPSPASDEDGAATVTAALMVLVLLTLTWGGLAIGSAVTARHRAQAAADLAALSAASRTAAGQAAACGVAEHVARSLGATLTGCAFDDLDVVVRTGVPVRTGGFVLGPASAMARAGPVAG
ncbi:Rv3654c family TadE-like protein [Mycobacterium sp. 4D054]|uniref:Rv3654c family TadE-like protein n=1 Tax=unclassified Mycobacterium TaxID=2642494 RepID=UPI0037CB746A